MELNNIFQGDCLEIMKDIEKQSIDMILCDLPYEKTSCKWDKNIELDKLWGEYKRIIKNNGAIVLTSSQPFTSKLLLSQIKLFRYEIIWQKNKGSNFQNIKYMPFIEHENILIFCKKKTKYNQIRRERSESGKNRLKYHMKSNRGVNPITRMKTITYEQDLNTKAPGSILYFNCEMGLHPTQKPVKLFEYLIKTYTDEGDLVLDNCMGSGTTAIACINLNRKWIGIEQSNKYYNIAKNRILEIKKNG